MGNISLSRNKHPEIILSETDICDDTFISLKEIPFGYVTKHVRSKSGSLHISSRCSLYKPLCRVSRQRRPQSNLNDIANIAKTVWPVKVCESIFLPEFKIHNNNFQILEEIGRGAFSKVYKVKVAGLEGEYAMKVLSKAKIVQEDSVGQVKEEVLIQSMCGHSPFIAACLSCWQNRSFLFIVSQYFCGGELWNLTKQYRTLPEDLVQMYVAEVALALDFLHNAGVIYRDMKLENIVLDAQGHAQLVDFGLSKRLKYGSLTSTICGTLQFIAPEVFDGCYGHAVDWWSLGVVACLLVTGEYPSIVQKRMANASKEIEQTASSLEEEEVFSKATPEHGGSAAVRDLLSRLLQPDPRYRLRSLLTLKKIAFFKGFSFEDIMEKKISPNSLLPKYEPQPHPIGSLVHSFDDFDSPIQQI